MKLGLHKFEKDTDLIKFDSKKSACLPVYLVIDWVTNKIQIIPREDLDKTQREETGCDWAFKLPARVDALRVLDFVKSEVIPVTQAIEDSFDIRWNGRNVVADWGGALDHSVQLYDTIEDVVKGTPVLGV
jgi:hypothetical protein